MRAWVPAAPFLALRLLATTSPAVAHTPDGREATPEGAPDAPPAAQRATGTSAALLSPAAVLDADPDRLERIPDALGLTRALGESAAAAAARRVGRHARRLGTSAIALLVLAFVLQSTPHLVHHALDPEHGTGCRVLQLSERSAVVVAPLAALPELPVLARVAPAAPVVPLVVTVSVPHGRAPPA